MTNKSLILLFGHENTSTGLSAVASSRCDTAIELLLRTPNSVILPTGTFGKFNKGGERPHASYLADYLLGKGVLDAQILPGTDSTNTFEDCLCARKVILDGGFSDVHVVTSDYHAPRVKVILGNVFRDIKFVAHEAPTPSECEAEERCKERKSRKQLAPNWITPPLYKVDAKFPEKIYDAAANDQRHYDTISLAVVTAIVVVSAFPFFSDSETFSGKWEAAVFFAAAFVIFALFTIYERAALTARTARRMLRVIEIGFGEYGFSANYDSKRLFPRYFPTIRIAVSVLTLVMFVSLVANAVCIWLDT
jgi:hypothetical protein